MAETRPESHNYSAMANERNPFINAANNSVDRDTDGDEETPLDSGIMIHVVPDTNKARWNHIVDLDSFFRRMYLYHQKHGFLVMMVQEIFELLQFVFVVVFTTYLFHCVKYDVLFHGPYENHTKVTIDDVLDSTSVCVHSLSGVTWVALTLAGIFWMLRLIKVFYHIVQYWDIKMFFNIALKIEDSELDNLTWHQIQKQIREVQSEQQMCIQQEQLTELDIYHRILRFKNYMVAMMNKNLIPAKIMVPLMGECVFFSRGLRYNIELILFRGPWSPFENNWNIRDEYRRPNRRAELSQKLATQILWVALANLFLCPLIFLWQLMYFFFNYGDLIKREPGTLGVRCWSQYGRLYLRHFNELDHELDARLNRAYRPAVKYMNSFSSPLLAVIGRNLVFICGGMLTVLIVLTIYDEDVVQVEHVLLIMSLLTTIVVISRSFIPEENMIWCPEQLMTAVLAHVHYIPGSWRGLAHTSRVRDQFGQLFQLRAIHLISELISPLVTPFVLLVSFRPRALDVVDFFRNFTVSVDGVGDVCSFAQMDVRKHGNPDWQVTGSQEDKKPNTPPTCPANQYNQGEHGKTELSLVHFTMTNPNWKMPNEAREFVHGLRKHALNDLNRARGGGGLNPTAMGQSLLSVGSMGGDYSSIVQSILQNHNLTGSQLGFSVFNPQMYSPNMPTTGGDLGNVSGGYPHHHQQQQQQYQSDMYSRHSFDFDRMLQQNLMDTSEPHLRGTLQDIREDGAGEVPGAGYISSTSPISPFPPMGASMSISVRGNLSRHEGPISGSNNGLLGSLTGTLPSATDGSNVDVTATDMSLSTLYLHELHHRQMRRRGGTIADHSRHIWQRPHQQPDSSLIQTVPSTAGSSTSGAAEKTPLLGTKKS